jgi:KUP system potassium uptake protein
MPELPIPPDPGGSPDAAERSERSGRPQRRPSPPHGRQLAALCASALGIVYGDIGTSPLYAMHECFHASHGVPVNAANILGVLSLIFWALIVVVTLKYHVYILRADNHGEGGILALMALVRAKLAGRRQTALFVGLGLFGAALLYGDGAITPAISVLSAVEGLSVATKVFTPFVAPLTIAILIGLFLFQRRGTGGIGSIFGPVMVVWFVTLALLGIGGIARHPAVFAALNPAMALHFLGRNGLHGFLALGGVFLVATGGEALYADMGHFGERPIQIDWFSLVGASLVLNYFGQGARLLEDPKAYDSPFYHLAPGWALYPLVTLATAATVIASQAVISGAFSLTRQAIQLGYLPLMSVIHTSARHIGQVYIPAINWLLMAATIGLVLGFRTSSNLAAAYGIAVSMTMVITTVLAYSVARRVWNWPWWLALLVTAGFLAADLAFFGANLVKVADGGWFPLLVGAVVFIVLSTWNRGRTVLAEHEARESLPIEKLIAELRPGKPHRVPGTAVFLSRSRQGTPRALLHNLRCNHVLHQRIVVLTIETVEVPRVPAGERVEAEPLDAGFFRAVARYGFMQIPSMEDVIRRAKAKGLELDSDQTIFFVARDTLLPSRNRQMQMWRERLFSFLGRNALHPSDFLGIPPAQVIELGTQVKL